MYYLPVLRTYSESFIVRRIMLLASLKKSKKWEHNKFLPDLSVVDLCHLRKQIGQCYLAFSSQALLFLILILFQMAPQQEFFLYYTLFV